MSEKNFKNSADAIDEFMASVPKDGQRWGKWRFRADNHTLTYEDHSYYVPLREFTSASNALDWVAQLEEKAGLALKTWVTSFGPLLTLSISEL